MYHNTHNAPADTAATAGSINRFDALTSHNIRVAVGLRCTFLPANS